MLLAQAPLLATKFESPVTKFVSPTTKIVRQATKTVPPQRNFCLLRCLRQNLLVCASTIKNLFASLLHKTTISTKVIPIIFTIHNLKEHCKSLGSCFRGRVLSSGIVIHNLSVFEKAMGRKYIVLFKCLENSLW